MKHQRWPLSESCGPFEAVQQASLSRITNVDVDKETMKSFAWESSSVRRITDEAGSGRRGGGARRRSPIQLIRLRPNMLKVGELISPLHAGETQPSSVWLTRRADFCRKCDQVSAELTRRRVRRCWCTAQLIISKSSKTTTASRLAIKEQFFHSSADAALGPTDLYWQQRKQEPGLQKHKCRGEISVAVCLLNRWRGSWPQCLGIQRVN